VSDHAALARQERAAALRALAAQFAHHVRNRLAATRAVCDNLRLELTDPDHQHRLQLGLNEIDRLLDSVSATVHSVRLGIEDSQPVDVLGDFDDVVRIAVAGREAALPVQLSGPSDLRCLLPRAALRAALYSLLEQLLDDAATEAIHIDVAHAEGTLSIRCAAEGRACRDPDAESTGAPEHAIGHSQLGLLVSERFACDMGGQITRAYHDGDCVYTLALPCQTAAPD
jgi:hypothetical protein